MTVHNIVSVSGGKDSTATLLLAMVLEVENLQAVFADTGHEHPETYEYIRYLEQATGVPIRWVKGDFAAQIDRKRQNLELLLRQPTQEVHSAGWLKRDLKRAIAMLFPTGNPFLDLCLWKGRFPSTKVRFCTEELKRNPIINDVFLPLLDAGDMVVSWQGIRRDESPARRHVPECSDVGGGLFNYRPILKWPVEAVFEAHAHMGIKPNPLYTQGMGRVGCMPCINCRKHELAAIAGRFPDEISRVAEWEQLVSQTNRRRSATFFATKTDPTIEEDEIINIEEHGIHRMVEWSQTTRGGRNFDLITAAMDHSSCSSIYGLCE